MATNFPTSLDALTNPSSGDALNSPSHAGQHSDANDAIEALQAKVGVNGSAVTTSLDYKLRFQTNPVLIGPEERWTVSATAATGTVNVDASTTTLIYYTSNASANWTFNFRGSASVTLNTLLATVNDSITIAFAVTNGATAYRATAFQIDGVAVTPKWQGGSAPSAGSANAIDLYNFTIVKTAATPTYTVFASFTKFA
jgi:hypothetical protein